MQEEQQRAARAQAQAQVRAAAQKAEEEKVLHATALRALAAMTSASTSRAAARSAAGDVTATSQSNLAATHAPLQDLRGESQAALLQCDADAAQACSLAPRGPLMYSLAAGGMMPRPTHIRVVPGTPDSMADDAERSRAKQGRPTNSRLLADMQRHGAAQRLDAMRIARAEMHVAPIDQFEWTQAVRARIAADAAKRAMLTTSSGKDGALATADARTSRLPAWTRVSALLWNSDSLCIAARMYLVKQVIATCGFGVLLTFV